MSKSVRPAGSNGSEKAPLEPSDFLKEYGFTPNPYAGVDAQETLKQTHFNPDQYEYITNPSSLDKGSAESLQAARQPAIDVLKRSIKQFGANVAGAIATGALNTADVKGTFDILTNKETDFNSKIFGVSAQDIMNWSNEVQQKNQIYEKNPGSFSPGKLSWWGKQFASSGTGVGMGLEALGETLAVGAATEGLGAIPELGNAISKFPKLLRTIKAAKTVEEAAEIANVASRLKKTATTYAILNRLNESKSEAQQTFQDAYEELINQKNPDGTNKYTEEQARSAAAAGARRDFLWNMPLMALDILTYRTMVFNPFSGTGTGLIEKGLEHAATKLASKGVVGKAVGWALPHIVGAASEGSEEGLQFIGSEEGKHYARVLAGLDDDSSFFQRLGKDVTSAEFWNNFAGGVIGSPIIGGVMKLFNSAMNGRQQKRLADMHKDFVANVGKMDDHISNLIREYEAQGNVETANVLRRNFGAMKVLSALQLDALKDSDVAFDSYKNFLRQTLDEVNNGKTDSLNDLGFNNVTKEQVDQIKAHFGTYLQDAERMKKIFDQVSNQHEKQFVPEIAMQMFSVETRREKQVELAQDISNLKNSVFGYSSLSDNGKKIHDLEYQMLAHKNELKRLQKIKQEYKNPAEQKNVDAVIAITENKLNNLNEQLKDINKDESYTQEQRDSDASLLATPVKDQKYYQAIRDNVANASQIDIESRNLALWNDQQFKNEQAIHGIINSRNKEQLDQLEQDLTKNGKLTDPIKEAIADRRKKLAAKQAIDNQNAKNDDVANPVANDPTIENKQTTVANPTVTTEVQVQQQAEAQEAESKDNGSVLPQGDIQSAVATAPEMNFKNFDMFSEQMAEIAQIANEQSASTEDDAHAAVLEAVSKTEITNIEDILNEDAGRLDIIYDGNPVLFKAFDVFLNTDNFTLQLIGLKYGKANDIEAVISAIKLGQELNKRGITFTSEGIEVKGGEINTLWDNLVELGFAIKKEKGYVFKRDIIPAAEEYAGPVEVSLAPVELSDNMTGEQKERLKSAVAILLQGFEHPTFEDLVRAAIKQSNIDTADKTFNLLTRGWELNGYSRVDYRQVYTKIFQDPIGTLNSLLGELATVNDPTTEIKSSVITEGTEAAIQDTIAEQTKPNDFDNNGQPIYNYTGVVTNEVEMKFAFLSVPYDLILTTEEDGSVTVKKQTREGQINAGEDVDSLKLLDPNKYQEGTELHVMIPSNFMDIKIGTWNADGTPGPAMSFGQYVAQNNLSPEDQEYKDKIPMIIYDKGKTNERGIAFIHDTQWYNPINFNQSKPGQMEQAIKSVREMRQAILDAKGKPVSITVTGKRETTFDSLKLPQGNQITLKEANPDTTIAVAININQLTKDGKNIVFEGQLNNTKPFSENMAYDVRQTGMKDGKPTYTAFPVSQPPLSDLTKSSILMALKVFVNAKNQNLQAGDKSVFDNVHAQILASSGIDIRSVNGITQYLSQFMHVANLENANSVAEAEAQLKGKGKKEGYKYLTINSSGGIVCGTVGKPMTPKNNGFFINPNPGKDMETSFKLANAFLDNIIKTNFLEGYQQHVHFGSLNRNKPVVQFNMKGEPTTTGSYNDYLMSNLKTNIRSINIGTKENPNYVTSVQPIITYQLTSKIKQDEKISPEKIREEIIEQRREESRTDGQQVSSEEGKGQQEKIAELRKEQEDLIKQAKEELGFDFLNDLSEEDLAPVELTDSQRESIEQSVQSIAGLNPQQQSELIDFMYNQVAAQIDLDNKEGISKEKVYAEVKKNFEAIIKPLRKTYADKVKQIQKLIDADPETPHLQDLKLAIASYNKSIQRINDIQANYKLMEAETELKVSKYTNIQKGKLKENQETDDDSETDEDRPFDEGDGSTERAKEFGTDSLSENPDNKLTYAMRRFLGQIRKVDKDGKPMTGFLKLPTYVGSDTVANTVRDLLADVPSDFSTMMAKLERSVPGYPWLRELIDRLQASTKERQNQFVTVFSNHRLSMKFSMISYDNKNKTWHSKVYDTFQSGLAAQLALTWYNNFIDSDLVHMVNEVYSLNTDEAQKLVDEYDSWIGTNVPVLKSDIKNIVATISMITGKKPEVTIMPTGELKTELDALKEGEKKRFKFRNIEYQIQKNGNQFKASFFNKAQSVNPENVRQWLEKIGIRMSDAGFQELMSNGLYHNFEKIKGDGLYTNPNGLFRILATALRTGIASPNKDLVTGEGNPLFQSVVKSLANLESNFNTSVNSPNGRDNGKSIFGFTAPKFITDRTRDLKTKDGKVIQELSTISFSKKSLWLDLLVNSEKFRDQFEVSHIGLTALKEMGKKIYRDNGITKLSDVDHELTKLVMFWDTKQGEVVYNNQLNTASDTTISMRMATMFAPTMSDKSNMMLLKTAVLNLEDKHFVLDSNGNPTLGKEGVKILYEQAVRPELMRMVKHAQLGGKTNISAYDKGAKMFLLIPELNYVKFNEDLLLIDAIANGVQEFNLEYIESRPELMNQIADVLKSTLDQLVKEKISAWDKYGFLTKTQNGDITGIEFMDKKYSDKFNGTSKEKVYKAAIDFELNSMIATANSFMLYAGDPAMYYKSKAKDYITIARDTFVNVGKRLANQIAPGTTIANSENERYVQLFLEDRKSIAEVPFLKFATRVNDGKEITDKEIEKLLNGTKEEKEKIAEKYPKSAGYFNIEGSDAQEYTTWKEHLSLLEKLGKTSDSIFEVTPDEIQEAKELFSSWENGKKAPLTKRQEKLIGKVLQPMKPVYTGQIYDPTQDAMRVVYIKSSSFPLIPQLTAGLEIDKLRKKMEDIEAREKKTVRASYQTANKVGSVNNPAVLWKEGSIMDDETLNNLEKSSLILDRKNFRIQQDVPFKSGKRLEDKITLGTQLMKVLFGNGVIDADDFELDGKKYNGKVLHKFYNDAFNDLIRNKKAQLYDELGLDESGHSKDLKHTYNKLQKLLKDEAINRGYPIQDIEGLNLDDNGNFITPLWSSANSNRYEAMLNAIVSNRLIKIKFPGNSYVVGSEEGFRFQDNLEGVDQSKIIWTSKWNGKGLQGSFKKNGSIEKAQVLVASKFRDNDGNLIDLFTKKDGQYIYVTKSEDGKWMLKEDMIDSKLLSLTSFRIPTSGHVSAAQVEIVGILPAQSADLMIVPRNFTKQMGLDFDIDKQYTYQLWHHMTEDGKFVELDEKIKEDILNNAKGTLKDGTKAGKLMQAIFGDELPSFTEEEIKSDSQLRALNSKLEEKILQNRIIKIHSAVLTNPDDNIQSKINGILSTDYAEEQADMIEQLSNKAEQSKVFTPLSSEYQKMKMGLGAAGKIGTGAYSLDVTFHSLVQQIAALGKPLQLTYPVVDEEGNVTIEEKEFRFGNQVSDGRLGNERTIDGNRTIAEVLAELQNIALDNEKLQVMGRVGLNDLTIDVSKAFALLGFDKGEDEGKSSVQFLFLSQPIVKEFVERMKNANSNMAEFSQDKEQLVVTQLLRKYVGDKDNWDRLNNDSEYQNLMSRRMSTTEMLAALKTTSPDGALQEAILHRFLEMRDYGVKIRSIQTGINADAKGLGKSFYDVIARREALNKIGDNNAFIRGASNLIGDYSITQETPSHVYIGNYWVKPTSLTGSFNIHAVSTAYNMWSNYLPYDAPIMNQVYDEIMSSISMGDNTSLIDNKGIIIKQEIFKAFKKYLSANTQNGIINYTDDIVEERKRLYIDSDTNTSLAKYIKTLRDTIGNKIIDNYIKTNKLINRFEFNIQKDGQPSLIKFNNAVGEEFDEQYLYNSLSYLLAANKKLPDFNGKSYTTTKLAQDLIAYTYLGNATQEAIQFTKYIPVTYTNMVGYGDFMRKVGIRLSNDLSVVGAKMKEEESSIDSNFTIQFMQHNPERVKNKIPANQVDKMTHSRNADYKSSDLNTLQSFSLVQEEGQTPPKYISIYNRGMVKGEKKFQLYMNQGDGTFKRIPVLGTFGMDEYDASQSVGQSLVNGKPKAIVVPSNINKTAPVPTHSDTFGINTGNAKTVLENISRAGISGLSALAGELAPYSSNISISYADIVSDGRALDNSIQIRSNLGEKGDYHVAMTILHEVIHGLTVKQISPYLQEVKGSYQVVDKAPAYVSKLVQLYNVARGAIGDQNIERLREKIALQTKLNNELQAAATDEERSAIRSRISDIALTPEEKRVQYGAYNIKEFMAMAMTQPEFQKEMAKYEYKNTGQSLLERFKEVLNQILKAIGLDYSEKSVTAQAINSIFELITDKNEKFSTPNTEKFNAIAEGAFGDSEEDEFRKWLEVNKWEGDTEESLSIAELPSVQSINENNCY
jgi:hypothetical protein